MMHKFRNFLSTLPAWLRQSGVFVAGLLLGLVLFYYFGISNGGNNVDAHPVREKNDGKYRLISPLIGFEVSDKKEFDEYLPLQRKVENIINNYRVDNKIISAAVYYRDMESGRWAGVNEDDKYSPASLYKVAMMIAYLKKAESEPALLEQQVVFSGSLSPEKPDYIPMVLGQKYTIVELLYRLIALSDNDAKDILHRYMNQKYINDVFSDLALDIPDSTDQGDTMSAKSYSRFIRILYSSTYLTRYMSELALDMLTKTDFDNGIAFPLPKDITVANKYGFRVFDTTNPNSLKELHDCGIIYSPATPYFLCVMTKGADVRNLMSLIQEVSAVVYKEAEQLSAK